MYKYMYMYHINYLAYITINCKLLFIQLYHIIIP